MFSSLALLGIVSRIGFAAAFGGTDDVDAVCTAECADQLDACVALDAGCEALFECLDSARFEECAPLATLEANLAYWDTVQACKDECSGEEHTSFPLALDVSGEAAVLSTWSTSSDSCSGDAASADQCSYVAAWDAWMAYFIVDSHVIQVECSADCAECESWGWDLTVTKGLNHDECFCDTSDGACVVVS